MILEFPTLSRKLTQPERLKNFLLITGIGWGPLCDPTAGGGGLPTTPMNANDETIVAQDHCWCSWGLWGRRARSAYKM
jgi:hypothetical protein